MQLIEKIKNKYSNIKLSLKESLFSKNKNLLRIKEFDKNSVFKQSFILSSINSIALVPLLIWTATPYQLLGELLPSLALFFLFFFIINFVYLSLRKVLNSLPSLIFKSFFDKNKSTSTEEITTPQFFDKSLSEKLKEFFTAFASISASYIPLIVLIDVILCTNSLVNLSNVNTFTILKSILEVDFLTLFSLSFINISTLYSFRGIIKLGKYIRNKITNKPDEITLVSESDVEYKPQRSFPAKEFSLSLSEEFKKTHHIENIYDDLKSETQQINKKEN